MENSNGWVFFDINDKYTHPSKHEMGLTQQVWGVDKSHKISLYGGDTPEQLVYNMSQHEVQYWRQTHLHIYPELRS